VTGALGRAAGEAVGTYVYTLGTLGAGANYTLSLAEGAPSFAITPKEAGALTIEAIADQRFTGEAITPPVVVKDGATVLVLATDYTVSYADNVAVGTATVTVTGIGNYTGTRQTSFEIGPGPATQFLITEPNGAALTSPKRRNLPFDARVTLADVGGNPVANEDGAITIRLTAGGGAIPGELRRALTPEGSGVTVELAPGQSSVLVESVLYTGLSGTAGLDVTLTATADGAPTSGTSAAFSVRDIVLTVVAADGTLVADGTSSTAVTVTLTDASSPAQPLAGQLVRVSTDLGTLLDGSTGVGGGNNTFLTDSQGQVALTLRAPTVSGTATITALCPGACLAQTTVVFVARAPDQIAVEAGDNQTAAVGTPVAMPPSVAVRDGTGNPVAGAMVTFAVGMGGGSITGPAEVTTNEAGIATIDGWVLGMVAGPQTLTATLAGSDQGASVTFTATATAVAPSGLMFADATPSEVFGVGGSLPAPTLATDGGEAVTFAIGAPAPVPEGLGISPATGVIGWTARLDAGTYVLTVTATNAGGAASAEVVLTITPRSLDETIIEAIGAQSYTGAPIEPSVIVRLGDQVLVPGLDFLAAFEDNLEIGTARVVLTGTGNYHGSAVTTFVIVGGVPGAPTELSGEADDARVILRWSAPSSDGGRPITGYQVQLRTGGQDWQDVAQGALQVQGMAAEVSELDNDRLYEFRVAAVNVFGVGMFTEPPLGLIPRAPVPDDTGVIPEPDPGDAVEVVDGEVRPLTVEVVDDTRLQVRNDDFTLSIEATDASGGAKMMESADPVLRLQPDGRIRTEGEGFEPGSLVGVWMFSEPTLLGHLFVDEEGRFGGELPVPSDVGVGRHTLQVTGIDRQQVRRAAALGVIVEGEEDLRIRVLTSETAPRVGDRIRFEIEVANLGSWAARAVEVNALLNDDRLRILGFSATRGEVDLEARIWRIGQLEAGEVVTLTLEAEVVIPDEELAIEG
jgi:hypothetical protein